MRIKRHKHRSIKRRNQSKAKRWHRYDAEVHTDLIDVIAMTAGHWHGFPIRPMIIRPIEPIPKPPLLPEFVKYLEEARDVIMGTVRINPSIEKDSGRLSGACLELQRIELAELIGETKE